MRMPQSAARVTKSLFVYGTLVAPQVIETLMGRVPACREARLTGYSRHPVRQQMYPGLIVADSSSSCLGVLYTDLTPPELKRLDWFEDVDYARREVSVTLLDWNQKTDPSPTSECPTETYVWTNPLSELDLSQEWSFEKFRDENLHHYLSRTVRPCRRELDRLGYE